MGFFGSSKKAPAPSAPPASRAYPAGGGYPPVPAQASGYPPVPAQASGYPAPVQGGYPPAAAGGYPIQQPGQGGGGYPPQQAPMGNAGSYPPVAAQGYPGQLPAFFNSMRYHTERDYVVIVDKSGSMNAKDRCSKTGATRRRWDNARNAIEAVVAKACEHDEDGITLFLFSGDFVKFDNVDSPNRVIDIFSQNGPKGSTNLTGVLHAAFTDHFKKVSQNDKKPTTILVITDGQPNDEASVITTIQNASNAIARDEDLSITFIQIGDDPYAEKFLKRLDDELDCKFDIVDTLKDDLLQRGLSFEELIRLSVTD